MKASKSPWYKKAIIYQLHIRAFYDSNGDGIGDFKGLIEKLDYLSDLGVTAIWLQPFYPSPLKDDGYDIADYSTINKSYGTLKDFRAFLKAAHDRGLKVITELVINHTSDQHEWFQRSRKARPGEPWYDFYVWTDNPKKYKEARIIFKDFESSNWSWDPVAKRYYWHRFYSHQPDLNFDHPPVREKIFELMNYWFEMGVDGMRLDAIPYLFEREGTSCENLPETHQFLKQLRQYIDERFQDKMLLAEANQWPEDAIAYFGDGDECHMAFHFPLMPRLFMALKMEDRFSILDILKQTPAIPNNCQWAMFLRNHDELTLEMVTDEERDYMYNMYASESQARINLGIRRRLAPLLGKDRRQIQLLNGLLFSMPGTPVIYYGDEIEMGDNIYLGDRDGVRTPFQWSPDRNAGFSKANPQKLYLPAIISPEYHYETVNVETQQANPNSMLWWMKSLISLKKKYRALNEGELFFLEPNNTKVLAFYRQVNEQAILVVANLSQQAQFAELNLSQFQGRIPVEAFGQSQFPSIGELPYFLTIAPYGFYWFELRKVKEQSEHTEEDQLPLLEGAESQTQYFESIIYKLHLAHIMPDYLPKVRWFSSKSKVISNCVVSDVIMMKNANPSNQDNAVALTIVQVDYKQGPSERYFLPLKFFPLTEEESLKNRYRSSVIAKHEKFGILADALLDPQVGKQLLSNMFHRCLHESANAYTLWENYIPPITNDMENIPEPEIKSMEQSNSSLIFGRDYILKIVRKLESGMNPDVEIGLYLNRFGFENAPKVLGALFLERRELQTTLGVVQAFVPNEGDAWSLMIDNMARFVHGAIVEDFPDHLHNELHKDMMEKIDLPSEIKEKMGYFPTQIGLLGKRTAELHLALSSDESTMHFAPEPFTPFYQRSLYQSLRNTTDKAIKNLKQAKDQLKGKNAELINQILAQESDILNYFGQLKTKLFSATRIRNHGDYHLGQVLYLGNDFMILDFEGEPARTLGDRRLKRCQLKDVAGMVRSFDYAVHFVLSQKLIRKNDIEKAKPWLNLYQKYLTSEFLNCYVATIKDSLLMPADLNEFKTLTQMYLLEKALYEINYELDNRPQWVSIPLNGIMHILRLIKGENDD